MSYDSELREFRRVLDEMTIVGYPKRDAELAELDRLICKHPDEARRIWASVVGP